MKHALKLLLKQFLNPIVILLLAAAFVSGVIGDLYDALLLLAIVVPSALLSFWQEYRANKTMKALLKRVEVHVEVIRGGSEQTVPISQLRTGETVILRIGDIVPGDMVLTESNNLEVDEASLTGESFTIEKEVGGKLFFGTDVVSGSAVGTIIALGKNTKYGALVDSLKLKDIQTSFEKGVTRFGYLLVRAMALLLTILFITNLFLDRPLFDSLLFSIALAVGLTPQLLPAIISVSLATGARNLAENKVLVKRLDAIEDFGQMNILCIDKTGTITTDEIVLEKCVDLDDQPSQANLRLAYLNASMQQGFKNPLDQAIIAQSKNVDSLGVKLIAEIPYDFSRRKLSVFVRDGIQKILITKGAFESVLETLEISEVEMKKARNLFEKYGALGYRVLALATGKENTEQSLRLVGLLVFSNPAKEGAKEALASLTSLGVDVFLLTGDNSLIARTTAKNVGLPSETVITGEELSRLNDEQLTQALTRCRIFSSVDPLQKKLLVEKLQAMGNSVGFFGDGINDVAALTFSDVGISVDNAVDIAKNAAAIVLLDKNLGVIAEGVKLGRKTFINTLKYARVTISANFGNMLSMAVAAAFLPFLPLIPTQILFLNLLSDFPALTISADNVDSEALEKPRTWDIKSIRNFMITFGLISSVFDLATFWILLNFFTQDSDLFRSAWFVESTLTELIAMLVLRTRRPFWQSLPGRSLLISSIFVTSLLFIFPLTPIGAAFQLQSLPGLLMLALVGLIAIYAGINEFAKRFWMRD